MQSVIENGDGHIDGAAVAPNTDTVVERDIVPEKRGHSFAVSSLHGEWLCVTLVLVSCIVGTLIMRIVSYFMPSYSTYGGYLLSQAAFTLPVQLLLFLAVPFCIYKFVGKRTVKQTLEYGSYTRFSPCFLLAFPLGLAVFFVTVGVSTGWTGLLRMTGYTVPSGSPDKPAEFNALFFVAEVLMTAVLPAVCEEFAMRGGLLTTVKRGFSKLGCIVFCVVAFGLFHQNVRQVFYTLLFGALAAYLVYETESIYPAVFMHFTNNFLSVYFDYASTYGFFGGGIYNVISTVPGWALIIAFVAFVLFGAAMVILMMYLHENKQLAKKRVALSLDGRRDAKISAGGATFIKPTLYELAGVIALGCVAALTTLFTYVWGFLY